jgi:hypothetical protein
MGVCSSCLGRTRRRRNSASSSQEHLLPEQTGATSYGTLGDTIPGLLPAPDPVEVAREQAALSRIVENASSNFINIFQTAADPASVPASPSTPSTATPATAIYNQPTSIIASRTAEYQRLMVLALEDPHTDIPADPVVLSPGAVSSTEREWLKGLSREAELALEKMVRVNTDGVGSLVGTFGDLEGLVPRR